MYQCRCKPLRNHEFCRLHFRQRLRLKFGIQGNPLPQGALHKQILREIRRRESTSLQWYSRDHMWTLAEKMPHVQCLADLSDEEYMDALYTTDFYHRKHARLRKDMKLECYKGPQCLADRGTEK